MKNLLAFAIIAIALAALALIMGLSVGRPTQAAPAQVSVKETFVAGAAQITLTSAVTFEEIRLTALGTISSGWSDNPLTARNYVYTVSLYADGVLQDSATTSWGGVFDALNPTIQTIHLVIPDGMVWGKLTVIVTP